MLFKRGLAHGLSAFTPILLCGGVALWAAQAKEDKCHDKDIKPQDKVFAFEVDEGAIENTKADTYSAAVAEIKEEKFKTRLRAAAKDAPGSMFTLAAIKEDGVMADSNSIAVATVNGQESKAKLRWFGSSRQNCCHGTSATGHNELMLHTKADVSKAKKDHSVTIFFGIPKGTAGAAADDPITATFSWTPDNCGAGYSRSDSFTGLFKTVVTKTDKGEVIETTGVGTITDVVNGVVKSTETITPAKDKVLTVDKTVFLPPKGVEDKKEFEVENIFNSNTRSRVRVEGDEDTEGRGFAETSVSQFELTDIDKKDNVTRTIDIKANQKIK